LGNAKVILSSYLPNSVDKIF